jgi:hypothetical protein
MPKHELSAALKDDVAVITGGAKFSQERVGHKGARQGIEWAK